MLPEHIAVILDGNNRWFESNKKNNTYENGHSAGFDSVDALVENVSELPYIKFLTLFAFSTENWKRAEEEVELLCNIFFHAVSDTGYKKKMMERNIKFNYIGDICSFDKIIPDFSEKFLSLKEETKNNTGFTLTIALNYGGRWDIANACKEITKKVLAKEIDCEDIDESIVSKFLSTEGMPDPDLLIRTSNEFRMSNFLLWQCAYTELFFTDVLWPDFDNKELMKAIEFFKTRKRNFGSRLEC
jgi:undecaprenyl diphosphate synthase